MKKIFACCLSLTMSLSAYALSDMEKVMQCREVARVVGTVMESRQSGVEMSKLMAIKTDSPEFDDIIKIYVAEAYKTPRKWSQETKKKAVDDFSKKAFLECYDKLN